MLISEKDILDISDKLKPKEREYLVKNLKEIKERINSLNLSLAKRIIIKKDKSREILIPSLESKVLQYYLKDKLKFKQYFYSFSYRKGKGSIRAMKLINERIKSYNYALKVDIKDFFPSIHHKILLDKLPPHLKSVVREIIEVKYLEEDKIKTLNRGLPLGNPLSGTLSNLYLSNFDKLLFLKCKYYNYFYLRYADDFIILGNDLKTLKEIKFFIKEQLNILRLKLNQNKTEFINLNKQHFDFLGYNLLKNNKILLKLKTKQRLKLKMNKAFSMTFIEFRSILAGIYGYTKHSQDYFRLLFAKDLYS